MKTKSRVEREVYRKRQITTFRVRTKIDQNISTYLSVQEGQALVDVLDLVDPHAAVVRFAQLLARDDLEQLEQLDAVGQVGEEVFDLHFGLVGREGRKKWAEIGEN